MKRLFLTGLSALFTIPAFSTAHEITHQQISQSNTVFAFDMHHTLVVPNAAGMAYCAVSNAAPKLAKLLVLLPFDTIRYLITGNGSQAKLIFGLCKLGFSSPGGEYQTLIEQYDPELWKTAEKMATTMNIIPGMQELTSELKSLGYTLRIASNGSSWEVRGMMARLPQLFNNFETDAQTVEYVGSKRTPKKPNLAYFTDYLSKFDIEKKIIFVDDKQENVAAAKQAGMFGIVFTDAQQLRDDLINLGIKLQKK